MKEEISVLMSVYNAAQYLNACIDSVLNQTHSNFLFYIVDDKSTDRSLNILKSYSDDRIRLIENENNIGLTGSLNKALKNITTKYIARIDADDICEPSRLASQLAVFEEGGEELALVGSSAVLINETGNCVREIGVPISNLKENLFFKNCFIHSTIMVRTDVLKKYKYDERIKYAQDYNLWVKISHNYKVTNLEDKLIKYRFHNASVSVLKRKEQESYVLPTINYQLEYLGFSRNAEREKFAELHLQYFVLLNRTYTFKDRLKLLLYLKKVVALNKHKKVYSSYLNQKLSEIIQEEKKNLMRHFRKSLLYKIRFN